MQTVNQWSEFYQTLHDEAEKIKALLNESLTGNLSKAKASDETGKRDDTSLPEVKQTK